MKALFVFLLCAVVLLFVWNYFTCWHCGHESGEIGTVQECAIDHSSSFVTRSFVWVGWQVNIYIPFVGCYSNNPMAIRVHFGPINITIDGWFKGWHRVPMTHLRYQ
jgi:hypothetical protein